MSTQPSPLSPSDCYPSSPSKCHCAGLCRVLLPRLLVNSLRRRMRASIHHWQLRAVLQRTVPRSSASLQVKPIVMKPVPKAKLQGKGKEPAACVSPIGKKTSGTTAKSKAGKKALTVAGVKPQSSGTDSPEKIGREEWASFKRPISVPPSRENDQTPPPRQNDASVTPPTQGRKLIGRDAGIRLFNQAIEIETKREEKRKSMEPDYPFTPRLAQQTPKWLRHKTAKSPITARSNCDSAEEVAVVSSAAVFSSSLNRVGLAINKTKAQRSGLTLNVDFTTAARERLSIFQNTERSAFSGCRTTKEESGTFLENFCIGRDSPFFKSNPVMVDFEGEESCETLPSFPTQTSN